MCVGIHSEVNKSDFNFSGNNIGSKVAINEDLSTKFCNSSTFIYIYPGPSKQKNNRKKQLYTLFGDVITASIPRSVKRSNVSGENQNNNFTIHNPDESWLSIDDIIKSIKSPSFELQIQDGRTTPQQSSPASPITPNGDTVHNSPDNNLPRNGSDKSDTHNSSNDAADSFVEYEILLENSNEQWTVFRRHKEFVALNRLLHRAGIRPKEPVSHLL